jgi:mono/diheme cytochrome c family protein
MHRQQKYTSQAESDWFEDRRTMRPPVEGTVSQTNFEANDEVRTGRLADDSGYVLEVPDVVAARAGGMDKLVKRGEQRYGIYCTPCHATTGLGNGIVVQRGYQKPPSLHDARIRSMPDGQLYATIRNGVRNMPAYGSQVPVDDRWAIVSYLRALQLTQLAQR